MSFGTFISPAAVARHFQIRLLLEHFLEPLPFPVDARFENHLSWVMQNIDVRASEAAICEFLIAPILQEVWKPHSNALSIWSHVPFGTEVPLMGTPDYIIARRSPLGLIQDLPYVLVIEAKKDDFEGGWGQCLAAMLAAQQQNKSHARLIYGCVSNGDVWQFGVLAGKDFTREISSFVLSHLSDLFAAWNAVFTLAKAQALASAA